MAFEVSTGTVSLPVAETTVLVVSEDVALADAVSLLLEEWGFAALIASDPSLAFDVCRSKKPNLVLLDMTSRTEDVAAFADRMSRELKASMPPLVALHSDDGARESMPNLPVAFLRAPFRLDDLQDLIEERCGPPAGWLH